MSIRIDHEHAVSASAEVVWEVITDLARYGEWNPFVVAASSSLVVGEPIDMKVRVLSFMTQSQRETISHNEPGRSYCYGLPRGRMGALYSERCHVITPTGPYSCSYESHFELAGWLSPVVSGLLGRSLRRGFTEMSTAVKLRAESLAPGGG